MSTVWNIWQQSEDAAEGADYEDYSVAQLKKLLKARDLPVSGTKAELIARLNEDG